MATKGDKSTELNELGEDAQSVDSSVDQHTQWCECNKTCYKKRSKLIWRTCSLGLTVFIYLLIGAGIFTGIERPNEVTENEMITESSENYTRLLGQLVDVLVNTTNLTRNQSIGLIEGIVVAAAGSAQRPTSDWEYGSSFFFVITVVTTIGYGTTAPSTRTGRNFFIIYALIGIPIALVFLASIGEVLKTIADWLARPIQRRWKSSAWVKLGLLIGYLSIGLLFYIIVPAIIFSIIQDWSYSESVYFCFVTLTTVGFGDFVPSADDVSPGVNGLYRTCTALWIFIGLGFLSLVISVAQDSFESLTKKVQDKRCECIHRAMTKRSGENKGSKRLEISEVAESISDSIKKEVNEIHDRTQPEDEESKETASTDSNEENEQ